MEVDHINRHVMNVMTILSHLISKGLRQPVMIKTDPLTCHADNLDIYAEENRDFVHVRTSPPWLHNRDLNLCHDLSHYSLQTCLIRNSAPHPTNTRSFIVLVTHFPLCHHHQITLSFPIVTRGFVAVPIEDGWMGTHCIRLCSIPRVPLLARNSNTALLIQLGIPIVSVRKLHKHSLHVEIFSCLSVDAIVIPDLETSSQRHL